MPGVIYKTPLPAKPVRIPGIEYLMHSNGNSLYLYDHPASRVKLRIN
jgi:hypothetical protein